MKYVLHIVIDARSHMGVAKVTIVAWQLLPTSTENLHSYFEDVSFQHYQKDCHTHSNEFVDGLAILLVVFGIEIHVIGDVRCTSMLSVFKPCA